MGLQSALSTALTGMNAAETTIDVVGNNVANANTVGFKESEAIFATQFLQTQSLGSAPTNTTGGTNPRQVGLGTKVAQISPNFTQGTIEISANSLDMAIQGEGFFIVQGSQGEKLYTRNGQFSTNSQNELVTITGQRVLGFGVDDDFQIQPTGLVPLQIPLGTAAVAQPTRNVFLEGTLIPTGDVGTLPGIIQSAVLSDGSYEVPTNLSSTDANAVNPPIVTGTTLTADPAPGDVQAGSYRYKLVAVDGEGNEGAPSAGIGPITTTGTPALDQSILLDSLPPVDGVNFVGRRLYRTDASGTGDYHFVTSLDATTTSYTDSASDANLAALPNAAVLNEDVLGDGNYSYYVTLYNSLNDLESRPTAIIGPVSGDRVRLENLPQPTTADFDSLRIYRNIASDDSVFYRVAELPAGTTSYIDGAPDAAIENPDNVINLDGPKVTFGMRLVDVVVRDGAVYSNLFQEGTLSFTPDKGGRRLATKQLEVTGTTSVLDLINFMEQAMGIQDDSTDPNFPIPGSPGGTLADSRLQFTSNMGVQSQVGVTLSAFTQSVNGGPAEAISLPFSTTQTANGEGAITDFVVYDSLGIPLAVRLTTVMEAKTSSGTTYRWFADSPDNDPATGVGIAVGTGAITFDGEGNVIAVSENTVSIDRRNVASSSPLEFDLDFFQISGLAEKESSLNASRQDGFGAGTLTSFIITETGRLTGVFSNGVSRDLGQLRLARFANNNGLEQVGENLFSVGVNSGLPIEGDPGSQGIGSITAGAVELSNTDIGRNLIELILASTQYRGGTRVITAVQQLLDELLALRR